uniref:Conotoxin Lo6/7b n=1 Tax=Conasprella longurionis TaxID=1077918 RepID=CU6B_CONLG|nr:RecName: Full=Conotoxin Lo6/7b [Conasprella longurionis]
SCLSSGALCGIDSNCCNGCNVPRNQCY